MCREQEQFSYVSVSYGIYLHTFKAIEDIFKKLGRELSLLKVYSFPQLMPIIILIFGHIWAQLFKASLALQAC